MDQPVYAVFKGDQKERDYPGFGQACADWAEDPNGKKVVNLGTDGSIAEPFDAEECQEAGRIYKESAQKSAPVPEIQLLVKNETGSVGGPQT